MRIIVWTRNSRAIDQEEADGFYSRPLEQATLFLFRTNRMDVANHSGAFSLKLALAGEETYHFRKNDIRLTSTRLLFVNSGERYASSISCSTTSMSVFFPDSEAAGALRTALGTHEQELDDSSSDALEIPTVAVRFGVDAATAISALMLSIAEGDRVGAHQHSLDLLTSAAREARRDAPWPAPTLALKRNTRDELIRRVLRAKELLEDTGGACCDLDALSSAACLSKFHFLRVFRDVYGETPAAFARRLRLQAAGAMIQRGEPVVSAMKQAGFTHRKSFQRAMRMLAPPN